MLAFEYRGVIRRHGGTVTAVAGLRERDVHDEAEGDDECHVDRDVHGMSGADERGGDQRCGTTEDGNHDLVCEADARYPYRGWEQFNLKAGWFSDAGEAAHLKGYYTDVWPIEDDSDLPACNVADANAFENLPMPPPVIGRAQTDACVANHACGTNARTVCYTDVQRVSGRRRRSAGLSNR